MLIKERPGAISLTGQERQIRVVFSDESVDRMGDVVVQRGLRLARYRANPISLFAHNAELPSGTVSDIVLDPAGSTALITFPTGVPRIDDLWNLIKSGVLRCVSIGFDPIRVEPMDPAKPRGPQRYLEAELCEISIVAIPANTNAQILQATNAKSAGRFDCRASARAARMECARAIVAKGERRLRAHDIMLRGQAIRREVERAEAPHPCDTMTPVQRRAYARAVIERGDPTQPTRIPTTRREQEDFASKHAIRVLAIQSDLHPSRQERMARAARLARGPEERGR